MVFFYSALQKEKHEALQKTNVLAACFSRPPLMEKPTAGDNELQDFKIIYLIKDSQEILCGETFFASDYGDHE